MNEDLLEYKVVSDQFLNAVLRDVRALIKDGFEPIGGISVSWSPGSFQTWAQAMIKKQNTGSDRCEQYKHDGNGK